MGLKNKGSFTYQSVHTFLARVFIVGATFLAGLIVARILGPEGKGVVSMLNALTFLLVPLAELGVRQSTAFCIGQKRFPTPDIYASMQGIYSVMSVFSVIVLIIIYWQIGYMQKYGIWLCMPFILLLPFILFENYHNGVFIGHKMVDKLNYAALVDKISLIFLLAGFIWILRWGVAGAGLSYLIARVFGFSAIFYWLIRKISFRPAFNRDIWKELIRKGIVFAIALFVINVNYRLNTILLGYFQKAENVGVFSVGVNFAEVLKEVPLAIGLVLFSRSANWQKHELSEGIKKVALLSRVLFLLMFIVAGFVGIAVTILIPFLYGSAFANSVTVTWILLPGIVVLSIFLVINLFVAGQGRPDLSIKAFAPAIIINVLIAVWAMPRWGANGAALASSVSFICATLFFVFIFRRNYRVRAIDMFVIKADDIKLITQLIRAKR